MEVRRWASREDRGKAGRSARPHPHRGQLGELCNIRITENPRFRSLGDRLGRACQQKAWSRFSHSRVGAKTGAHNALV